MDHMFFATMAISRVILLLCLFCTKVFASTREGIFNKIIIPKANLQVYDTIKLLGLSDCISLCILHENDKCEAVTHDQIDQTCSFGSFIVPATTKNKIISKDQVGQDDLVVYGRGTAIKPKAGYVPLLLSFFSTDVSHVRLESSPEVTGDVTPSVVGTQPLGDPTGVGVPSFVVHCGNGFVACGGVLGSNQVVKTCRKWSYKSGEWSLLPGEMSIGHLSGTAVLLANRLYAFIGSDDTIPYPPVFRTAEMYDFAKQRWESLPDFPYAASDNMILAISDTEILLGLGIIPSHGYECRTYVFNTITKEYTFISDLPTADGNGIHGFRCGLAKGSLIAVCMGGINEYTQFTTRVQRFDIVNKQWLTPRSTDDVSVGGGGRMVTIHRHMPDHLTKLYFVKEPSGTVYEIHYDDKNDGDITMEDLGITSALWGHQLLIPIYYDEILE